MNMSISHTDTPEDVGLSSERLKRITDVLKGDVEKGLIPGAVVLVARHGKIALHEAVGLRDREAGAPMAKDTVFRIASMTKPFTSVSAMMLAEEGKLLLADPVSRYLPAFANLKVGIDTDSATVTLASTTAEPLQREMTVHDLLRHTSGLTYGPLTGAGLKQAYEDAKVADIKQTNEEMVAKLAKLPLAYQPGSTWQYSLSTDVLGRVVEVVSGMALDAFIAERICKPLGLTDTSFDAVDPARAAEPQIDAGLGKRPPMLREAAAKPTWISGGSGLMSTAADYARFTHMLLNGGALDGTRLLSPTTVTLMASDHLPPGVAYGPNMRAMFGALAPVPENGIGFGLGFAVRHTMGRNPLPGSPGDYSWSGVSGTYFWIDPQQQLVAILMMQAPIQRLHYRYLMRTMVYQALIA
jgi:CubicO group peptidase (beta-lactamase class C family)